MPLRRISPIIIIAVILLTGFSGFLSGQETKVVQDIGLWTGVEVEKEFLKDWRVSLKQEFRFETNMSELDNYFTQGGLRYQVNRNFAFEAKYRYTRNKKKDDTFENKSRYSLDINYKGKIDFISVYYRLRYQKGVESMNLFDPREPYHKFIRHRVNIRYNDFKKIEPYLSSEFFQLFEMYEYSKWIGYRLLGGIIYEPGDWGEFRLAYGFERELNSTYPYLGYVLRLNYTYSF